MKVVIIIPTYNEKENISILLKELLRQIARLRFYKFKILVVDDNSPDGTGEIVKEYQNKYKNIYLLSHKKDGLGRAMIRGYVFALKDLKPDIVVTNEADFGFDFKHLPMMLEKIRDGNDVIVASRHVRNGKTSGWTFERKLNHYLANTVFARWLAGITEVYDKNGAFRAIRVKGILEKIKFNRFEVKGFAFFFYLIYELSKVTNKFYEFPSTFKFRKLGESKVSFNPKYIRNYVKDIFEYINIAFKIRLERSNINSWLK